MDPILRAGLLVAILAMLTVGCVDRGRDISAIEGMLPTVEQLGVRSFRVDGDCERIEYERGAYESECADAKAWVEGDVRVIDARSDLDTIDRATRALGGRLAHAYPRYRQDGINKGGSFGFYACVEYVYDPGYRRLPPADSESVARVNDDWYVVRSFCSSPTAPWDRAFDPLPTVD